MSGLILPWPMSAHADRFFVYRCWLWWVSGILIGCEGTFAVLAQPAPGAAAACNTHRRNPPARTWRSGRASGSPWYAAGKLMGLSCCCLRSVEELCGRCWSTIIILVPSNNECHCGYMKLMSSVTYIMEEMGVWEHIGSLWYGCRGTYLVELLA